MTHLLHTKGRAYIDSDPEASLYLNSRSGMIDSDTADKLVEGAAEFVWSSWGPEWIEQRRADGCKGGLVCKFTDSDHLEVRPLSKRKAALAMGCNDSTIQRWRTKNPDLDAVRERIKAEAYAVANAPTLRRKPVYRVACAPTPIEPGLGGKRMTFAGMKADAQKWEAPTEAPVLVHTPMDYFDLDEGRMEQLSTEISAILPLSQAIEDELAREIGLIIDEMVI